MKKQFTSTNFLYGKIKYMFALTAITIMFITNPSPAQQGILIQPDDYPSYEDFGNSVDISGNYAIVGARGHIGDGNGGFPAIYFFKRDGNNWVQTQSIRKLNYNGFGWRVAISDNYAIASFFYSNETLIYERVGDEWIEKSVLAESWEHCGADISGDFACVGNPSPDGESPYYLVGQVTIYKNTAGTWIEHAIVSGDDLNTGDGFGYSVSLKDDYLIVGAYNPSSNNPGKVYIFKRDGESWYQEAKLTPDGGPNQYDFGISVDISDTLAIVGASDVNFNSPDKEGYVYFFNKENDSWIADGVVQASDGANGNYFGLSVAIKGDVAFVGAPGNSGKVYQLSRQNSVWTEIDTVIPPEGWASRFGYSVSLSNSDLIVGDPGDGLGYAYIYQYATEVAPHHFYFRESDYSQQIWACEDASFHFEARNENDQIEQNFSGIIKITAIDDANNLLYTNYLGFGNGVADLNLNLMPAGENVTIHLDYQDNTVTGVSPYTFDVLPYWEINFRDDITLDYNVASNITVNIHECGADNSFPDYGNDNYIEFTAEIPGTGQSIGSFDPLNGTTLISNGIAIVSYTPPTEEEMGGNNYILFKATFTVPDERVWVQERAFQLSGSGGNGGGFTNTVSYGSDGIDGPGSIVVNNTQPNSVGMNYTPTTAPGDVYSISTYGNDLTIGNQSLDFPGGQGVGGLALIKSQNQDYGILEVDLIASKTLKTNSIKTDIIHDNSGSTGIGVLFESGGEIEIGTDNLTRTGYCVGFAKYDSDLNVIWQTVSDKTQTNSSDHHYAGDMAIDNTGDVTITGYFQKEIIFYGPNQAQGWTGTSPTDEYTSDLFIVKYGPTGNVIWGYQASSNLNAGYNTVKGTAVTTDSEGNSYVAGSYAGGVAFGSSTFENYGGFILKFDMNGNLIWSRKIDGGNVGVAIRIGGLVCDSNGGLYLTGESEAYASFSGMVWDGWNDPSITYTNMFIAKYNTNGEPLWVNFATTSLPSSITGECNDIDVDYNSNVYITGNYSAVGPILFGDIELTPSNTDNNNVIFVASYDIEGNPRWAEMAADEANPPFTLDDDRGTGISVDSSGVCYVTGTFSGDTEIGGEILTSNGGTDVFLCKVSGLVTSINHDFNSFTKPSKLELNQNYPNPFNPTTTINYKLPLDGHVSIIIYDILGREVETLVNEDKRAGIYSLTWDAKNISAGIYFYNLKTSSNIITKKMLLLK